MGTTTLGGIVTAQRMTVTTLAAGYEVADAVIMTMEVPTDAVILDVILETEDNDTGATLAYDVGDAAGPTVPDDDRFITAFSGQAIGSIRASDSAGLLEGTYAYTAASSARLVQNIEVTLETVAATGTDGDVTLTVIYMRP